MPRGAGARARGPQPTTVIVSASGSLDPGHPGLHDPGVPVVIVTTSAGGAHLRALGLPSTVEVIDVAAGDRVEPGAIVDVFRDHGLDVVVCEGGPTLMGTLVDAGLIDELFLTVAPQLRRSLAGHAAPRPRRRGRLRGRRRPVGTPHLGDAQRQPPVPEISPGRVGAALERDGRQGDARFLTDARGASARGPRLRRGFNSLSGRLGLLIKPSGISANVEAATASSLIERPDVSAGDRHDRTDPKPSDLRALPDPSDPRATAEAILFEIRRVIVGQDAMLERVLVGLLSGGHLLLEGVPGLAKTLTIKTLADVLGGTFKRIQFTPDLMPSDLVGTRIYRPDLGSFDVEQGPVFANFLLADEINRAPAKVQSALLEVMQEHQVTIGHDTFKVPSPFLVLATENPIEAEGTYPLPEAQVDRFMLKILLDYPNPADEAQIVARSLATAAAPREILDAAGLLRLQQTVNEDYVDPPPDQLRRRPRRGHPPAPLLGCARS